MCGKGPKDKRGGARKRTLITLKIVIERTSLSKTRIYEGVRRGTFPPPVRVSARRRAWVEDEVTDWIDERVAERDAKR